MRSQQEVFFSDYDRALFSSWSPRSPWERVPIIQSNHRFRKRNPSTMIIPIALHELLNVSFDEVLIVSDNARSPAKVASWSIKAARSYAITRPQPILAGRSRRAHSRERAKTVSRWSSMPLSSSATSIPTEENALFLSAESNWLSTTELGEITTPKALTLLPCIVDKQEPPSAADNQAPRPPSSDTPRRPTRLSSPSIVYHKNSLRRSKSLDDSGSGWHNQPPPPPSPPPPPCSDPLRKPTRCPSPSIVTYKTSYHRKSSMDDSSFSSEMSVCGPPSPIRKQPPSAARKHNRIPSPSIAVSSHKKSSHHRSSSLNGSEGSEMTLYGSSSTTAKKELPWPLADGDDSTSSRMSFCSWLPGEKYNLDLEDSTEVDLHHSSSDDLTSLDPEATNQLICGALSASPDGPSVSKSSTIARSSNFSGKIADRSPPLRIPSRYQSPVVTCRKSGKGNDNKATESAMLQ